MSGSCFGFTYYRPGKVIQTDDAGRFEIPGFLELHRPFDSGLEPWIEWIYLPALHHVFSPIGLLSESRRGVIEIDWEQGVFRFADFSDDREGWSRSIGELDQPVRYRLAESPNRQPRHVMPEAMDKQLEALQREEFRAFMERHAQTPRVPSPLVGRFGSSKEEIEARERSMREDLERYPTWGHLMRRRRPELAEPD